MEGFTECKNIKPDLVIVDIMVPSLNGLEILRQMKKALPRAKVIVFSAYSTRDRVQAAMKAGANGIVHKNASIEELEKALEELIAKEDEERLRAKEEEKPLFDETVMEESEAVPAEEKKLTEETLFGSTEEDEVEDHAEEGTPDEEPSDKKLPESDDSDENRT